MNEIVQKKELAPDIDEYVINAPLVASKCLPGQFVVLRLHEEGERIPITIADFDRDTGFLTLVIQEVGKTTMEMGTMKEGDVLSDVIGPLGRESKISKIGTMVAVGGGIGIPAVHPIARAFKEAGSAVISVLGARNKELLIWEERMRSFSDKVSITTDDGSYGKKGFVTDALKELIDSGTKIDQVTAIGPAIMMKMVSEVTRPKGIKTVVSLNSLMLDATGMCGVCRVEVGGKTKFACVDGPEFDGHEVNFDILMSRLTMYLPEEKESVEAYKKKLSSGK
ncbi:sulfide/dihydroorotate dehydrogenase-like FAD/NAD-binding protein [candidate division TA06 bacterium]|uniref:Sulfide/dihydroorotate dehydrogenase-like FAD/NAD-binding protein n=1 Tax=candidate division TA06 bacterium TaxID=2250710 RepID=A0A523XHR3_UNCT6|nr:MAG: sulfide/dihydroorotate dehydrogenase-like FAD/NAD-binding protein [candidate division TA06 bacterium]